ncbi:H-NS histone family protein [Salmonella enterica subsp. enterica serovar Rissen]|nr:H-NS histone family protein [Escherichia coli]EGR6985951.1 H-NS histone family protein [Salmonella enterica subsp. enterica serovar Rissen]
MSEEYEAIKRILSNIRSLRVFARECDFEWLEEVAEKFRGVVEERREDHNQELKQLEAQGKKIEEARELLASMGLTPDDLVQGGALPVSKAKKPKLHREPKYIYTDESGEEKTWAGVGRTPKAIQTALESGRKLEEFLINKD